MQFAADPAPPTATFTAPAPAGLPDGNYTATLLAGGVTDIAGQSLDGNANGRGGDDHRLRFFVLAGDANGDRTVNAADLGALSSNYGRTGGVAGGVDFSRGDFNYDGVVNVADLGILSRNLNRTLPPPTGA